jgi:hypothetical protein
MLDKPALVQTAAQRTAVVHVTVSARRFRRSWARRTAS